MSAKKKLGKLLYKMTCKPQGLPGLHYVHRFHHVDLQPVQFPHSLKGIWCIHQGSISSTFCKAPDKERFSLTVEALWCDMFVVPLAKGYQEDTAKIELLKFCTSWWFNSYISYGAGFWTINSLQKSCEGWGWTLRLGNDINLNLCPELCSGWVYLSLYPC